MCWKKKYTRFISVNFYVKYMLNDSRKYKKNFLKRVCIFLYTIFIYKNNNFTCKWKEVRRISFVKIRVKLRKIIVYFHI